MGRVYHTSYPVLCDSLFCVAYDSTRPTNRPPRNGVLDRLKAHVSAVMAIGTFASAVVGGAWVAYSHFATDEELMSHNMNYMAHPLMMKDLVERVDALEQGQKKMADEQRRQYDDLSYVAERYVRLVAADSEPDRRKAAWAGERAVQDFRALVHRGSSVQDAVHEALRH